MKNKYTYLLALLLAWSINIGLYAQCTNGSAYGTATAPAAGATITITSCQYASEYATVNSVAAATSYISATNFAGAYFTVHQGTPGGPVIAFGAAPLAWTSTVAGTYYIHLNTNAACGTDFNCHTHTINRPSCSATTPTSVTATPGSICAGSSTNLRALSAGNTIRWYTVASGGASIGSSASGANFAVSPGANITYYAEAFNGSCASGRVAVAVTVTPSPAAPTPVTATPNSICAGTPVNLNATAGSGSGTISGFTSVYAPANWTTTHTPVTDQGIVNTSGAPNSISITSSNSGNFGNHSVIFTVTVPASGNITFNWSYVTTDVDGPAYDIPQYYINGVLVGNLPGFNPNGADIQNGTANIAVTAGQTFSFVMTATDDILGAATAVISNFTAPGNVVSTIQWFTVASGGASIGSSASGANFAVSPASTITYYAQAIAGSCPSPTRTPVTVTVNTPSTAPAITPIVGTVCPNTNITINAGGGTAGTGSAIYWYTGPNGTGTFLGTGNTYNLTATTNTTLYIRREGACNVTADDSEPITVKSYIYAANGTSSNTYCTDNAGWNHFYSGNNIIFSLRGDLSAAPAGFPVVTIYDNNAYYQNGVGPNLPTSCVNGWTPGEERFEMERSWNVNMGGGAVAGGYEVRFYYQPAERAAIENAAIAWMAAYPACNYTYKYPTPLGFYWFKNSGANYAAPLFDATHYPATGGVTSNGVNYGEWSGITGFSGGSGSVILVPDFLLPVDWKYFTGTTDGKVNFLKWATASEERTSHFEVQRSLNGIDFETIGTVAASGTSSETHAYQYNDLTPFKGMNYYRLRLLDLDGAETISDIVALEIGKDAKGYVFYPNPTQNTVFYQYSTDSDDDLQLEVVDVLGRILYAENIKGAVGANQIAIELGAYPAGNYLLRVKHLQSGVTHVEKVTKD